MPSHSEPLDLPATPAPGEAEGLPLSSPGDAIEAGIAAGGGAAPAPWIAVREQPEDEQRQRRQARILTDATREFGNLTRPGTAEIAQYKEIFYQLIPSIAQEERRLISAMLARSAFTPRAVALYFAHDRLEVAAPFILFSPVLTPTDLAIIESKKGADYRDLIKRRSVTAAPGSAQLRSGEIAESGAASITGPKAAEAAIPAIDAAGKPALPLPGKIETDADRQDNAPMKVPMENRVEDPTENPMKDPGSTEALPSRAERSLPSEKLLALAGRGGRLGREPAGNSAMTESDEVPLRPRGKLAPLDSPATRELLHFARTGDHAALARKIASICGLSKDATLRLIGARPGDELLYLIKALAVPTPHDLQLMLLLKPQYGRRIENFRSAKRKLAELDSGICRMIFNEIGANFALPGGAKPFAPAEETAISPDFRAAVRARREGLKRVLEAPPAGRAGAGSERRIAG